MNKWLELTRIKQWYKNVVIFLPLVFVGALFNKDSLLLTIAGFFTLCLASSASYIFNDIKDRNEDKKNPEKKDRPIAAGTISIPVAAIIALILLAVSLAGAFMLSLKFALGIFSLFAMTMAYTLWLKNKMFLDILAIAVNFVIRTISGAFILSVIISPWVILCTFFLSLFLSAGKRASELKYLKEGAVSHRKVLAGYTPEITNMLLIVSTVSLVMSYSLYTFMSIHPRLIYTLPFALYLIFRFVSFIYSGSDIARHLDRMVYDKGMMIGSALLLALIIAILYF